MNCRHGSGNLPESTGSNLGTTVGTKPSEYPRKARNATWEKTRRTNYPALLKVLCKQGVAGSSPATSTNSMSGLPSPLQAQDWWTALTAKQDSKIENEVVRGAPSGADAAQPRERLLW